MTDTLLPVLDGVKVVEMTSDLGAAYGGRILSELGADVVKVEPTSGDPWRQKRQGVHGVSGAFSSANAGKRSVAVDADTATGREFIDMLVNQAKIVIIDSSGSVADESFSDRAENRRLVVTVVPDPSDAVAGAFLRTAENSVDLQAKQGTLEPVLPQVHLSAVDVGVIVGVAATSWLVWDESTAASNGPAVARAEIIAQEVGISLLRQDLIRRFNQERVPPPFTTMRLQCQDGYALAHVGHGDDSSWRELVGEEGLDLRQDIMSWASRLTRTQVEEDCQNLGLPVGSVLSVQEMLSDPQIVGRGYASTSPAAGVTALLPFLYNGRDRWVAAGGPPSAGEHSSQIAEGLGLSARRRTELFRAGVLR